MLTQFQKELWTRFANLMNMLDETAIAVRASALLSCAGAAHRFGDV